MRTAPVLVHVLVLACGAACSTISGDPTSGSVADVTTPADSRKMAEDVAKRLVSLYPPARTRFNLKQPASDAFGTSLVQALRLRGYALVESKPGTKPVTPSNAGAALSYVVDQPLELGQYRVTVQIDAQSISRIYQTKGGTISPDGYWIRKE